MKRCSLVASACLLATPAAADPKAVAIDDAERDLDVPVAHALGLMSAMRLGEALLWPEFFANGPFEWARHYGEAVRRPPVWDPYRDMFEWDGDRWYLNVFGHGLFGSELYLRPRICGHEPPEALLFAVAGSVVWEYAFEGNAVRPSGLDLWYTPLTGMVLGEARYFGWQAAGLVRQPTWRTILRTVLDPLGELERALGAGC